MELHFFPGENLLILKIGERFSRYSAMGGPSGVIPTGGMELQPTWPGKYIIDRTETYRTPTWPMSKIKWGTELQDKGAKADDVWYKLPSGQWGSVKKDVRDFKGRGITRAQIIGEYKRLYKRNVVPKKWVFNDFGPFAIRWFRDLNDNKILDGSERLSGQMFHTTPDNEAQKVRGDKVKLVASHGCIHLKPSERDTLRRIGAFKPGTAFTVHKSHERFGGGKGL